MANEWKLVLKGRIPSVTEFRNIFYYRFSVAPTGADLAEMHTAINDVWLQVLHEDAVIYGYDNYQWVALDWQYMSSSFSNLTGMGLQTRLPTQCAVVLIGKTATKRTFGRKFIGPIGEGVQDDGVLVPALLPLVQACADIAYTTTTLASGTTASPMTWSHTKGFHDVISQGYDTLIGSQRRRKPGVGI